MALLDGRALRGARWKRSTATLEPAAFGGWASQLRTGAARPSAFLCSDQTGGRSISRLTPKPRRRCPLIAPLDKRRIEKGERQRPADGSFCSALVEYDRGPRNLGLGDKAIKPESSLAVGAREGSSGFHAHRGNASGRGTLALHDLPTPAARRRDPCDGDRSIALLLNHLVGQPDEEPCPSDRHLFDARTKIFALMALAVGKAPGQRRRGSSLPV